MVLTSRAEASVTLPQGEAAAGTKRPLRPRPRRRVPGRRHQSDCDGLPAREARAHTREPNLSFADLIFREDLAQLLTLPLAEVATPVLTVDDGERVLQRR